MNPIFKIMTIMLLTAFVWVSAPARLCRAQQPSFTVQVMSGADKDAAARFVEKLMQQGFEASIAELEEKEKPVYKVRVGNFANRKAAEQLYEVLRMKGFEGWVVRVFEQAGPQAHAAEKPGSAPAQSHEAKAQQEQPDSENATAEKPFELILNPVPPFTEDNKTAPSMKTESAPAQPLQPTAAQQPVSENAVSEKLFELVINPVPTFAVEAKQTAQPAKTEPAPVSPAAKTYKYFNPADNTIHITRAIEKVPAPLRRHIWEIAIFPIYFKNLDLRDMSISTDIDGRTVNVVPEGIIGTDRTPPVQAVRDFEAALHAKPLRIKYYPARTDPDGTLHGALFFSDGSSVEMDMIRRRLATCAMDQLSFFQQKACTEAQQKSEGSINTIAPPP